MGTFDRSDQRNPSITLISLIIVILAVILDGISAAPTSLPANSQVCRGGCPTSNKGSKLKLQPGQLYVYDVNSVVSVSLQGGDKQETKLELNGEVHIQGLSSECQYALHLEKVRLLGTDNKQIQLSNDLPLDKIVRFTLANDRLEPEICSDESDTTFSLNIKRSIISLLQSDEERSHENDVYGSCPTSVQVQRSDSGSIKIAKQRDLALCSHRETLSSGILQGVFNEKSGVKSTSLLNSEYLNDQQIDAEGVLQSASLSERYDFAPLATKTGQAGARASVITKLKLQTKRAAGAPKIPSPAQSRTLPLAFENPSAPVTADIEVIREAVKNLRNTLTNNIGAETAERFVELVRLLRQTPQDVLTSVHQQIKSNSFPDNKNPSSFHKIFLDALFRAGTKQTVELVANLIKTKVITDADTKQLAFLTFNLAKEVSSSTIPIITDILKENQSKEALLSIGNLVKKYCQQNSCSGNEVQPIVNSLASKLKCDKNINVVLLKAIGNTNNLAGTALDKVLQCTGKSVLTRGRVAAIQALAAAPCNKVHSTALNLLKDREEDSEIRIEAYLILAGCPSDQVVNDIQAVLNDEPSYQVGSFITSHLASVRYSTDVSREQSRNYLSKIRIPKKYPRDIRKYSFNQEGSYELGQLGLGSSVDASVIYSPKSFLPRSARVNLTGELFGKSFNVLELSARQENLESILENYFGPKGKVNQVTPQDAVDWTKKKFNIQDGGNRKKRGLRDEVQRFGSSPHPAHEHHSLDLSLKLFGSELVFLSLGDKFIENFEKNTVSKLKSFTINKHALFLDTDLVYPTGIGFPLRIEAQGSASVYLKSDFKKDDNSAALELIPSYSLLVSGALNVDGYAVNTALKLSGTIHSSTGAKVSLKATDRKRFELDIQFASKKQELVNFEHKVVFITQEKGKQTVERPVNPIPAKTVTEKCFDQLSSFIGATFCVKGSVFEFPAGSSNKKSVSWLLNGPNSGSIWVDVETNYKFVAEYENRNDESRTLTLEFNTPGGKSDRKTSVVLKAETSPQKFILAKLQLPDQKVYSAELGITNTNTELAIYSKLTNANQVYEDKIGFKKSGSESRLEYIPIVHLSTLNTKHNVYEVSGKIIVDKTKKPRVTYDFQNLQINAKGDSTVLPVGIDGSITHLDTREFETKGLQLTQQKNYVKPEISVKLGKKSIDLSLGVTNNYSDKISGKIELKHNHDDHNLNNYVLIVYGPDLQSANNRFELSQKLNFDLRDKKIINLKAENSLKAPFIPLDLKLDAQHTEKVCSYDAQVKLKKNSLSSKFHLKRGQKVNGDWDLLFNVAANAHRLDVVSTRDIDSQANKSHLKNKLTTSEGTEIELNSDYLNVISKDEADITATGRFVLLEKQEPYNLDFALSLTKKNAKSHAKVSSSSEELASYDVNVNLNGGDTSAKTDGTVTLSVKDVLKGSGRFEEQKSKGLFELLITLVRSGRKLNLKDNYEYSDSELKINSELYYDYEKDNAKKIAIKTDTKYLKNTLNTKNELDVNGEKYALDFNVGHTEDAAHRTKTNGDFKLRLPSQREISGDVSRESGAKGEKHSCQSTLRLKDTLSNKKSRTLTFTGSVTDGQLDPLLFNVNLNTKFVNFENKDLVLDAKFKHLPTGHFKTAVGELKLSGAQVPNPVEVVLSIDEYCEVHAVYHSILKYGSQTDIKINGNYNVGERGGEPSKFEIKTSANVPDAKWKQIQLTSSGELKLPRSDDENGLTEVVLKLNGNVDDQQIRFDTNGNVGKQSGQLKLNVNLPENDPVTLDLNYNYNEVSTDSNPPIKTQSAKGSVDVKYGKGKSVVFSGDAKVTQDKEFDIHGTLQTSYEQARNLELRLRGTKKGGNTYSNEAILNVDKKEYKLNSFVTASSKAPSVDLNVYYPEAKHSQIKAGVTERSDNEYEAELNVLNLKDFNLAAKGVGHFRNVDNFGLVLDLDSPTLEINKLHVDIKTKQQDGNKGIRVDATSDNKNILNGDAKYSVKEENGKTVISGDGSLRWYDKPVQATFELSRKNLEEARDKEIGVQLTFSGSFNANNIVSELKLSNKNFVLKNNVCKSHGHGCANIVITSKLKKLELNSIDHELIVVVDLRPYKFQHEFKLGAETQLEGWVLNHNLEISLQTQDKVNYLYKVYVQPSKSGVTLVIPSRTVAIEAVYVVPNKVVGKYEASLTSYLDKEKNPGKKSSIGFLGEIQRQGKSVYTTSGSLKINHPSTKELKITGTSTLDGEKQFIETTLKLDIFKNTNQELVIKGQLGNTDKSGRGYNVTSSVSVTSRELGIDYSVSGHAGINLNQRLISSSAHINAPTRNDKFVSYLSLDDRNAQVLLNVLGEDVFNAQATLNYEKKEAKLHSQLKVIGVEPVVGDVTLSGYSKLKASVVRGQLFNLNGEINVGEKATLTIVGNNKPLITSQIALDSAHFLNSEYTLHEEDLKAFLKSVKDSAREDTERSRNEINKRFEGIKTSVTNQINKIKENLADFKNVNAEYKQELEKFSDELLADKNIKEFAEFFKKIHQTVGKTVNDILRILTDNFKKIGDIINNSFKQIYETFNDKILPSIKESLNKISKIFQDFLDETLNLAVDSLNHGLKTLKSFEGDFAKVGKVISENLKSFAKILSKQIEAIRKELTDIYQLIVDNVKQWEGFDAIKHKIEVAIKELEIAQKLLAILKEGVETIKTYSPITNFNDFIDQLSGYLEKKLNNTPNVNDVEELKKIIGSFFKAIKELIEQNKSLFAFEKSNINGWIFLPTGGTPLPNFYTLKSSLWNYIENEKWPSITDLIRAYRPHGFNPLNLLPPFFKEGHIINGETILTFDGRHLTLPGNCKYLVAQDTVNNSFSVIATIGEGKLKSIAVLDKSGVSIEVLDSGVVNVNDAQSELPVHDKDLHAWRDYYTVNILSKYGVEVQCKIGLKVCHVVVNGYYHNKLRGLFGNGNYEAYDDYHLADGKVSSSASDFGNSFKLQPTCPAVAISDQHSHAKDGPKSKECENILGSNSPLRVCNYFIDPAPFLEACEDSVSKAQNKEETACNIALGYASYCRYENVLAYLPKACSKCTATDASGKAKTYALHEKYKVTAPQNQADVVLVVDTAIGKPLEEIVNDLIKGLRTELKTQGITDVHTSVIGYQSGERFVHHYTSNGQLDIAGNWRLTKPKSDKEINEDYTIKTGIKKVDDALQVAYDGIKRLNEDLGLTPDGRAFREALSYPFRSGASKAIIAIRSDVLTKSVNPIKAIGASFANSISDKLGVTIHLLGPIAELKFDNQKDASQVVGFNSKSVVQISDTDKRGSTELRPHLSYGSDLGIDLVQNTDRGYAFSLTNYNNLKSPAEKKQFLDAASSALAAKIGRTLTHGECICTLHNGLYAKEACWAVDSKVLAPHKKKTN